MQRMSLKLIILFLLNVLDILLTLILISSGKFFEINPIINKILDSRIKLYIVKIVIPLLLILYLFIRLRKAEKHQLIISNKIINGALIVYACINLSHIFWLLLYP